MIAIFIFKFILKIFHANWAHFGLLFFRLILFWICVDISPHKRNSFKFIAYSNSFLSLFALKVVSQNVTVKYDVYEEEGEKVGDSEQEQTLDVSSEGENLLLLIIFKGIFSLLRDKFDQTYKYGTPDHNC